MFRYYVHFRCLLVISFTHVVYTFASLFFFPFFCWYFGFFCVFKAFIYPLGYWRYLYSSYWSPVRVCASFCPTSCSLRFLARCSRFAACWCCSSIALVFALFFLFLYLLFIPGFPLFLLLFFFAAFTISLFFCSY